MKYGILKYIDVITASNKDDEIYANIGDFIQIYAIRELYKEIGIKDEDIVEIGLNELKTYSGEDVLMPLHLGLGYSNIKKLLPVSKNIVPRFMSLTMIVDLLEDNNWLIEYFKKYEPIGCRDEETKNIMSKYGIKSYLVGCATIIMKRRKHNGTKNYLVDVPQNVFKYIPKEIIENSILTSHEIKLNKTLANNEEYINFQKKVKKQYLEYYQNAKLIVSSRLHAIAPAIAMGIPCICVTKSADMRFSWVDKYVRIYQDGEYNTITWDSLPINCINEKNLYKKYFENTIFLKDNLNEMTKLDSSYLNRKKTLYNKGLRNKIEIIKNRFKKYDDFAYIIWGGGMHAYIVRNLMKEYFPNSKLEVIVDKFEVGQLLGVEIIKPEEISEYKFDICIITTFGGRNEAKLKLKEIGLEENRDYFEILSKTRTII